MGRGKSKPVLLGIMSGAPRLLHGGAVTCKDGLCATRLGVTVLVVLDAMPDSVRVFRG